MSKPLNEMTNEELEECWHKEIEDGAGQQSEINHRLLSRTRETVLLLKRICQHLGLSQDTTDTRQG